MGEKIHGGSAAKEFADSSFHSPDLNPDSRPTTTTHHGLILQDFFTPSSARGGPAKSGAQANYLSLNFEALRAPTCSTTTLLDPFLKKRSNLCDGDRRFKRMMKNRESASRSRSRRMAYICELEKKKTHLKEENARLRRALQRQELLSAAAATNEEPPKKHNLLRSLSALF